MPQHRSPSPRLNLGRLKRKQDSSDSIYNPSTSSPRTHGSPNSSASPLSGETPINGGNVQTPLNSVRLGGMLSQRRQSRFGRVGSLVFRPDRRDSVRFDSAPLQRKLVPVPEDLTREEVHQVEEDFARFGPISSHLELTEFLTTIGENVSEDELLVLLKRIVAERSAEEASVALMTARSRDNVTGDTTARGRLSIIAPHGSSHQTPTAVVGGQQRRLSLPTHEALHDADEDSTSTPTTSSHSRASGTTAGHMTTTNKELRALLQKRFLRPFFALEDTLVLLRHIKAGVLLNRLSLDEAKEVFDALCADGLGVINAVEFMHITKTFSLKLDVEQFVRDMDEDGSGQIELPEFRALLGRVSGGGRSGAQSFATIHQRGGGPSSRKRATDDSDEEESLDAMGPLSSSVNGAPTEKLAANYSSAQHDGLSVAGSVVLGAESCADDQQGPAQLSSPQDLLLVDLHGSMHISVPAQGQPMTTGWMTRSPTSTSLQLQPGGDASTILDAHLRQIRRDLVSADADPLAGIEATKPLASYIALQKRNSLAPVKVRLTRQQEKKERSAKDMRGQHQRRVVVRHTSQAQQQHPRRLAPIGLSNPGHTAESTMTASAKQVGAAAHSVPREHHGGGGGLPPMLRPNRQPFHVAEGVFPEWRESYLQHMRPL
jgi:hypothetical protein